MAKQIFNEDVTNIAEESLIGYALAYGKYFRKLRGHNAIVYKNHRKDRVALVIGGGSGHDPLFQGFTGAVGWRMPALVEISVPRPTRS